MSALAALLLTGLLAAADADVTVTPSKDDLFTVSVSAQREPVLAIVHAICGRASLPVQVAPELLHELREVVVSVDLKNRPIEQALEWIGGAAGIEVRLANERVTVTLATDEAASVDAIASRAIDLYRRALVRYADHPEVARLYLEIGRLQGLLGNWPLALLEFETVLRSFPSNAALPEALYESGHAYLRAGDVETGRQRLLSLTERRPDSPLAVQAYLTVARSYQDIDNERAVRLVRHALESFIHVPTESKLEAAELICSLGEYLSALELCDAIASEDLSKKQRRDLALLRLRVQRGMGDSQQAVRTAQAFLAEHRQGEDAVAASLILADLALEAERPFEALNAAAAAERLDRGQKQRYAIERLYALAYRAMELPVRALAHFEKALSAAPDSASRQQMAHIAAQVALADQQFEVARRYFDLWRQSGGPQAKALLGTASCFVKEGKTERALEVAEAALASCDDEDDRQGLLALVGSVHERAGDYDRAARAFSGGGRP